MILFLHGHTCSAFLYGPIYLQFYEITFWRKIIACVYWKIKENRYIFYLLDRVDCLTGPYVLFVHWMCRWETLDFVNLFYLVKTDTLFIMQWFKKWLQERSVNRCKGGNKCKRGELNEESNGNNGKSRMTLSRESICENIDKNVRPTSSNSGSSSSSSSSISSTTTTTTTSTSPVSVQPNRNSIQNIFNITSFMHIWLKVLIISSLEGRNPSTRLSIQEESSNNE